MRRAVLIVAVAGLAACASTRQDAAPTRVRLITWPESARVSLDCEGRRSAGKAPIDFEFPDGPYTRCKADIAADRYQPMHLDIDRQYLMDHGKLKSTAAPTPVRFRPYVGPMNWPQAIALTIEVGLDRLLSGGRNAALAAAPDVTLEISLQREPAS